MKHIGKALITLLALALLFEEWLWTELSCRLQRLARLPAVQRAKRLLRSAPPWASLLLLLTPALLLLPFKILGLWALSRGHLLLGLSIVLAAKIVGTAAAAFLFDLVRDNARQIPWFDALYLRVVGVFAAARAWLDQQPAVTRARRKVGELRLAAAAVLADIAAARRRSPWARKLRFSRATARCSLRARMLLLNGGG